MLHYNWGLHYTYRSFYPYYHRRYVFVSLGGYWPLDYSYTRYYWYGYHPYRWYGYYPIARQVVGDTNNYYTYNYYNDDTPVVDTGYTAYDVGVVDHTTFADVRERLAQQALEPAEPTLADRYFEDAIGAFELNNFDRAAELFAKALELAPDDMILPFAYCQALFAGQRYTEAAEVLRAALAKVTPEEEGVFYPRGLYSKDDVLFEQMNKLAEKAELYSFDPDLQLLLGYNLLGIGELDDAVEPLRLATLDLENAPAATVLLNLLEKMRIKDADKTE
ncbi:MAG: tetratricopeptide repeat protein [Planctomycetes bacterium]|nr:tetratricopeptide repeat protein [Planctomycetota bacterium]